MKMIELHDEEMEEMIDALHDYLRFVGPTSCSEGMDALVQMASIGSGLEYLSEDMRKVLTRDINRLYNFFEQCTTIVSTKEKRVIDELFEDLQVKGKPELEVDDLLRSLKWEEANVNT